ncbi:MAG: acyl-ACP--UDP-N-acetylglucosamine O-acyltransferase [Candidatus Gastranaerophilales bacterium]|nr:acyl-ACP--UDP-N-acetylglucosamine O-acyltransferase [Candidatus Gastranaerophilales bacterium]
MTIHKSAVIADSAIIPESAVIGPNVIIGENVKLGENVKIIGNAYLECCEIGDNSVVSPFASIGTPPQDLSYQNEPTKAIIGKDCLIKEYVTVNRASGEGNSTIVGDRCLLMASSHVAHNCVLEDEVIMANLATIGGHCKVGFGAFIGGMSVFHQNVRIGEMCIISGFSASRMDILPYCKGDGRPPVPHGINVIGLKRRGITLAERTNLKNAFKIIQSGDYTTLKAADVIEDTLTNDKYIQNLVRFIRTSKRGIVVRGKN